MKTINDQIPASGTLPDNYQEVLSWKFTEKPMRVIAMNILSLFLFVIFGWIFSWLAFNLGKLDGEFRISLSMIGLALAGVLLTSVLHELTHGLAMRMLGASPKYGIKMKWLVLYATTPGYAYHRNSFVVMALAPFVCLSILAVLGMWLLQGTLWVVLLGICGALNASAAIGDMWITMIVLRYAPTAYVMERDGMRVFLPKPLDEKIRPPAVELQSVT
jgi:hypothetical protein